MIFRNKLDQFETEEDLFDFFQDNARYLGEDSYTCAGLYASYPHALFEKLKEEWEKERSDK